MVRWRGPLAGLLAALAGAGAPLTALSQPMELEIRGSGVLSTDRGPVAVTSVTYTHVPDPARHAFTAQTAAGAVTFSGGEAGWPDKTHASVALDSVLSLARSGIKDETSGTCDFEVTADLTYVKAVTCRATTPSGGYALRFSLGG